MHKLNIDPWFINKAKQSRDGWLHAYDTLEARKTALVVVDMQNDFVANGMPACAPEARTIVPNINRLAQAMRTAGGTVIWIQTEARLADPQDWANRQEAMSAAGWAKRQALLAKSGEGFAIYPTCEVLPEDQIAIKYRYSAFIPYPSALDGLLRTHSIDTLLITGVATSTCCESTARDAAMWGYRTIMVSDGNADQTDALHNHTLGKFLVTFGDVQATDEVLAKLSVCRDEQKEPLSRLAGGAAHWGRLARKNLYTMAKQVTVSAGLLLYRRLGDELEVFLAHPGGPFWAHRDTGAWSIPKGLVDEGEEPLAAACREFEEETSIHPIGPFLPLGSVRQKAGKLIHAWAWEGDANPAYLTSNLMRTEWPRGSGRWLQFPEIDRCAWFDPQTAREKLNPAQAAFIDRLEARLS